METELKLKLRPSDLERIREHPMLAEHAVAGPTEHRHVDTYYDTPDHELWRHGLTLRVRAEAGAHVQTAKTSDGPSTALHSRGEWECALPDEQVQPALLARQVKPARLAALLASPDIAGRLRPVFSGTTRRTIWDLRFPGGETVECALDAADFTGDERHRRTAELELELKDGAPDRLFEFALALHRAIPLELANDSKAARGYALLGPAESEAVKARPVPLRHKMTLGQAFQCIGLNCLGQMEANVAGVLAKDVESLHQMRVGLRRLRALLDMFEPLLAPPQAMREGLDWLANELGATRDWDVLADATLNRIEGMDPSALRDSARAKAARLHSLMLRTLHAPRFTELMLALNSWLRGGRWRDDAAAGKTALGKPAARAARPLLRKAEKRLGKRIGALDPNDAPARHRVRIAAKKARYGAEFFHDLLDKKTVKQYVARLSEVQDRLGLLNDMAVAGRLLPELQRGNGQLARDAAYARGYLFARSADDTRGLSKALKAIEGQRMTS